LGKLVSWRENRAAELSLLVADIFILDNIEALQSTQYLYLESIGSLSFAGGRLTMRRGGVIEC
jgi:hypothetical protein